MKNQGFMKTHKMLAALLAFIMLASVALVTPAAAETAAELPTQTQTVTAAAPAVVRTAKWDFSASNQLSDFTLYQSGTSSFTVADGALTPNGANGEMKATFIIL